MNRLPNDAQRPWHCKLSATPLRHCDTTALVSISRMCAPAHSEDFRPRTSAASSAPAYASDLMLSHASPHATRLWRDVPECLATLRQRVGAALLAPSCEIRHRCSSVSSLGSITNGSVRRSLSPSPVPYSVLSVSAQSHRVNLPRVLTRIAGLMHVSLSVCYDPLS